MAKKDFIAQLFRVRRERYGISDDIFWGWYNPEDGHVDWKTWPHADADGIGGFAKILRRLGFPCTTLPVCNETYEPSWLEIICAGRAYPRASAPKRVHWKQTYPFTVKDRRLPEVSFLTQEQTAALKNKAAKSGVSVGDVVFSTLSRVIAQHLISSEEPFYWFLGVNVRGAARVADESFNQASGISLLTYPDSNAAHWREQIRLGLKSKRHWVMWKLAHIGKYIGDNGLSLMYRLSNKNTFYAGSCANMGDWPLDDKQNPNITDNRLLCAVGPGTKNYPVNASLIGWNGMAVLVLKLHPFICENQAQIRTLVDAWRDELLHGLA
ncbi:MAG: hypothetical protein P1U67_13610 [Alcanivoracaceae bacterium]|nr:hypothetical protein [Alcanivoracaceae bacterium]